MDSSTGVDAVPLDATGLRWLSFALLAIAGWTDAVGFILFAGSYVSFMSGDATQFGVNLGTAHLPLAFKMLAAQVIFVAGAAVERLISIRMRHGARAAIAAIVAVLLALAAVLGGSGLTEAAFVAAILGMGMLNGVMHQVRNVPVGTMITGVLVRLGENIADRLGARPAMIGENAGQWAGFVGGAALGAVSYEPLRAWAFIVPALACATVAVLLARSARS